MKKTSLSSLLYVFEIAAGDEYFEHRISYSITALLIRTEAEIEGAEKRRKLTILISNRINVLAECTVD